MGPRVWRSPGGIEATPSSRASACLHPWAGPRPTAQGAPYVICAEDLPLDSLAGASVAALAESLDALHQSPPTGGEVYVNDPAVGIIC